MSVKDQEFVLDLALEDVFAKNHWKKGLELVKESAALLKNWEYFLDYTHCWILDSRIRAKQMRMLAKLTHNRGLFKGESLDNINIQVHPSILIEWSRLKATEGFAMLYAAPLKKLVWKHTEGKAGNQLNNLERWVQANSKPPGDVPQCWEKKIILALELQPELETMANVLLHTAENLEKVLPKLRKV